MLPGLLQLMLRRAVSERHFVALRFVALTLAVAIASGVFIYLDALGQSALNQRLAQTDQANLNIAIRARTTSIGAEEHKKIESRIEGSVGDSLDVALRGIGLGVENRYALVRSG